MTRAELEALIRRYYDGCNRADRATLLESLTSDAVHYFPRGAPQGPFFGSDQIADGWIQAVEALGSQWTIERILVDEQVGEAVVEWTHYKRSLGVHLRGDEWMRFRDGRISEIRAYYACPPGEARSFELGGFDYRGRGYSLVPQTPGR